MKPAIVVALVVAWIAIHRLDRMYSRRVGRLSVVSGVLLAGAIVYLTTLHS